MGLPRTKIHLASNHNFGFNETNKFCGVLTAIGWEREEREYMKGARDVL